MAACPVDALKVVMLAHGFADFVRGDQTDELEVRFLHGLYGDENRNVCRLTMAGIHGFVTNSEPKPIMKNFMNSDPIGPVGLRVDINSGIRRTEQAHTVTVFCFIDRCLKIRGLEDHFTPALPLNRAHEGFGFKGAVFVSDQTTTEFTGWVQSTDPPYPPLTTQIVRHDLQSRILNDFQPKTSGDNMTYKNWQNAFSFSKLLKSISSFYDTKHADKAIDMFMVSCAAETLVGPNAERLISLEAADGRLIQDLVDTLAETKENQASNNEDPVGVPRQDLIKAKNYLIKNGTRDKQLAELITINSQFESMELRNAIKAIAIAETRVQSALLTGVAERRQALEREEEQQRQRRRQALEREEEQRRRQALERVEAARWQATQRPARPEQQATQRQTRPETPQQRQQQAMERLHRGTPSRGEGSQPINAPGESARERTRRKIEEWKMNGGDANSARDDLSHLLKNGKQVVGDEHSGAVKHVEVTAAADKLDDADDIIDVGSLQTIANAICAAICAGGWPLAAPADPVEAGDLNSAVAIFRAAYGRTDADVLIDVMREVEARRVALGVRGGAANAAAGAFAALGMLAVTLLASMVPR